jgi:hypothetical protein
LVDLILQKFPIDEQPLGSSNENAANDPSIPDAATVETTLKDLGIDINSLIKAMQCSRLTSNKLLTTSLMPRDCICCPGHPAVGKHFSPGT